MVILFWCIREKRDRRSVCVWKHSGGAEDAALWGLLLKKDPQLHDRILDQMFTNNYTYSRDPEKFDRVYTQLLESLEKYS